MKSITQYKQDSTLSKIFNYGAGIGCMTRKEFMHHVKAVGGNCYTETVRDYEKEEKEKQWLSANAWSHPWGNECHPATIAYNERKNALKDGIYKTLYRAEIPMPGIGRPYISVITKTEYDYYQTIK